MVDSVEYLATNFERVPVHVIPCMDGRVDQLAGDMGSIMHAGSYGSIFPAVWNFMLALRSRGLGSTWTCAHLMHEREASELPGIPYESVTQTALITVAYTLGTDFKPALRRPLDGVMHLDSW